MTIGTVSSVRRRPGPGAILLLGWLAVAIIVLAVHSGQAGPFLSGAIPYLALMLLSVIVWIAIYAATLGLIALVHRRRHAGTGRKR